MSETSPPMLRVHGFGMSFDGFSAGFDQDLEHPLCGGGEALLTGLNLPGLGCKCPVCTMGARAMHVTLLRRA